MFFTSSSNRQQLFLINNQFRWDVQVFGQCDLKKREPEEFEMRPFSIIDIGEVESKITRSIKNDFSIPWTIVGLSVCSTEICVLQDNFLPEL